VLHVVNDGMSHMFALACLLLGIPVVGSFHTDLIDLLNTHGAYWFQKALVLTKEYIDWHVLDSCATTSPSFSVFFTLHSITLRLQFDCEALAN
jgi:hypothetical protein